MKKIRFLLLLASLILISGLVFAQETNTAPAQESLATETDIQWVWGEVVSVSLENKEILVKYMDYETDNEKEMSVVVDDKTIYENAKSLEEIKPQDTLSIDYIVTAEGKNIAKTIGVEKPEALESLPAGTGPEVLAPSEEQ
ncbi:MAG: hypothetical protein HZA27_05215 [Candidatus Omnitrophica bacterium]|nr:hypothetical protein [Candidatus Omnitrophota bacterium]